LDARRSESFFDDRVGERSLLWDASSALQEWQAKPEPPPKEILQAVDGGKVVIDDLIGTGAFGFVYSGHDASSKIKCAIKFEKMLTDRKQMLLLETHVYEKIGSAAGFPRIHWSGEVRTENGEGEVRDHYMAMAMDLLGRNLKEVMQQQPAKNFSMNTVRMIADQVISRLESLHRTHYVHRDIKPSNFEIGLDGNEATIYLIDMGLAAKYSNPGAFGIRKHIIQERATFQGNARYASVNAHNFTQGRRDDMEATGYMLVHFAKGQLPWSGSSSHKELWTTKNATSTEELVEGLPGCFKAYFEVVKNMSFQEKPDYKRLRKIFQECFDEEASGAFDWQ
jgi:serine/threonine protein kinase